MSAISVGMAAYCAYLFVVQGESKFYLHFLVFMANAYVFLGIRKHYE